MILKVSAPFQTLMELTLGKHTQQNISDIMKEEVAVKLRQGNFISVMADGGVDFGILEEVLVYEWYLSWELGRPVYEYLVIQEPNHNS